jgi:ABC-type uncharacterized transport system permease subunit
VSASPLASTTKPTFAGTPWRERAEEALIPPLVALLVALICGDLLILSYGQSPAAVYRMLLEGTWGNAYGFGQVLYKATTLAFTGLAVSFGLRAGLFNIGGESQLAAGGFAAALTGLVLPSGTPLAIALILCMVAAGCAGGVVGAVPAYLKTRFGAHEVIVTIMLNFIVLALLNWFIAGHLHVPETLHTPEIHAGVLPRLADINPKFHGSAANLALVVAVIVAVAVWFYLFRSRGGYELRAVGLQPEAAEYGGISVGRVWMKALTFSGVIAGMGGINYVLGYKHYYEDGFATAPASSESPSRSSAEIIHSVFCSPRSSSLRCRKVASLFTPLCRSR